MEQNIFTPRQQREIAKALGRFQGSYSWDGMPTSTLGLAAIAELLEYAIDDQTEAEFRPGGALAINSRHLRELIAHLFTPEVEAIVKQVNEREEAEIREAAERRRAA